MIPYPDEILGFEIKNDPGINVNKPSYRDPGFGGNFGGGVLSTSRDSKDSKEDQ